MNITGGKYNRHKIIAPDEHITRPTLSKVRMAVFNSLSALMDFENKSFLDMYAGSGIMGLEAISRGFSRLISIEKNKKIYNVLKNNCARYEKEHDIHLYFGDSLNVCAKFSENFDVIYIDPPYMSGLYEASLDAVKSLAGGIVILEHSLDAYCFDGAGATDVICEGYEIIKQKKYSDKYITFLRYTKS